MNTPGVNPGLRNHGGRSWPSKMLNYSVVKVSLHMEKKKFLPLGSKTTQIMCPHHRTSVSKLLLMQGNMVISCSSAFSPQTFCHAGTFFFLPNKQEAKSCPQPFCQLPVQLLFVQVSGEPDRGLDINAFCPAQSSRTCPDGAPREVEEEVPSQASQLVLR